MLPDVAALRQTYEKLSDEKLLRLATERASTLRPEALALLRQVVAERGLGDTVAAAIDAQVRVLDNEALLAYCEVLRALPCPVCQSQQQLLNATITSEVLSFLVMTTSKKKIHIACPTCLNELNRKALTSSALLGWWGFPWGIIRTIGAIAFNSKMQKNNHLPMPSAVLQQFVRERVGRIEAQRQNPAELRLLIAHPN